MVVLFGVRAVFCTYVRLVRQTGRHSSHNFAFAHQKPFFFLFLALCFVRLVCFFLLIFFYLPLFWGVLSSRIKVCVKWVVLSGCWGAFLSRGNLVYAKHGICLSIDGHRH